MTCWLTYLLANNRDNSDNGENSDNIDNTDNCDHSDTRDMCISGRGYIIITRNMCSWVRDKCSGPTQEHIILVIYVPYLGNTYPYWNVCPLPRAQN